MTPSTRSQKGSGLDIKHKNPGGLPFIDLFCGAGGLSVGFEQVGFQSVFALDFDPYATATFQANHPATKTVCGDIKDITSAEIFSAAKTKAIPLIVGGPNCQGVSLRGKRDPNDPKNKMFYHYVRLIKEVQPEWFVMENVPGLLHRGNRELATDIFREFESIGYRCGADVLLAADFGVPQLRYRLFIIGTRTKNPIVFPRPTHMPSLKKMGLENVRGKKVRQTLPGWLTVREAISDLPPIPNGGGTEFVAGYFEKHDAKSAYQTYCRRGAKDLLNHFCHQTNDYNMALIKHIPEGGNWKSIPEKYRPPRFKRVALKDHTTTYGRLDRNMPARTITCYFNNITCGAFTHPTQDRGISVREAARFQSFPDTFRFIGPLARQARQVGNAVPCLLAKHVAQAVLTSMNGKSGTTLSTAVPAAVEYSKSKDELVFNRPLKGMRFNLDEYLVIE